MPNLRGPWREPGATIPRRDIQREKKTNMAGGRGKKKREIFGGPAKEGLGEKGVRRRVFFFSFFPTQSFFDLNYFTISSDISHKNMNFSSLLGRHPFQISHPIFLIFSLFLFFFFLFFFSPKMFWMIPFLDESVILDESVQFPELLSRPRSNHNMTLLKAIQL